MLDNIVKLSVAAQRLDTNYLGWNELGSDVDAARGLRSTCGLSCGHHLVGVQAACNLKFGAVPGAANDASSRQLAAMRSASAAVSTIATAATVTSWPATIAEQTRRSAMQAARSSNASGTRSRRGASRYTTGEAVCTPRSTVENRRLSRCQRRWRETHRLGGRIGVSQRHADAGFASLWRTPTR